MKQIILTLAFMLTSVGISAAPRTSAQALQVARKFVASTQRLSPVHSSVLTLAPTAAVQMARGAQSEAPAYYVCNIENGGYVVVSGDDRFKEVLGYSLDGTFTSESELPDGLRYWLSFLSEEMNAAIEAGYDGISTPVYAANATNSVEPLIKSKWNQNSPYNNLLRGNMTGCVATGTAQVMRFWQYPARGTGSHTGAYAPNFSADFGATAYDWKNMLYEYGTGWESKEEVDAVATLMLHVGVATDMRWDTSQSATPNAYAAYALINYFGYNKNLYIENRDQVSAGAWKSLLIDQLQTGHPLCYSGMSTATGGVGHFFVCDGYDAQTGLFHFNWGWSGRYDGYYEVSALEPGTGGIGAGMGSYNYYQTVFVNVQPLEVGQPRINFTCTSLKVSGTTKKNIAIGLSSFSNDNTGDVKGNLGLAVYDNSGNLVKYIPSEANLPIAGFHIGSNFSVEYKYSVDVSELSAGTYTVCPAAKSENIAEPFRIRAKYDNTNYYTMEVTAAGVKLTAQSNRTDISVSSIRLLSNADGNVFQNTIAEFEVTVTNNSAQEFNDEIGVRISRSRGTKIDLAVPATLAPGETKTILVSRAIPTSLNINDGYTAQACYGENGTYTTIGSTITVNVKAETDGIRDIIATEADNNAPAFNIAGQRVSNNAKGLIIKQGKKTLVN